MSEITVEEGVSPDEMVSAFGFEYARYLCTHDRDEADDVINRQKDFELRKRGTRWQRSGVLIEVYQLYAVRRHRLHLILNLSAH